ncbi:MAG TPA: cytochrome c oxidase accessory protein CcoG [Gammaproteobacteria bacterium]|nr:cytochrome c oxidase accessory protein CcoG [Gammaproteobacteria bacterium]
MNRYDSSLQSSTSSATPTPSTEDALYEKSHKIYPREVHGLFATARVAAATILLGIFYLLPWVQWDGRQAVLFDLPARKFYLFGLTLWPQDFLYLTFLLMLAAYALFFFTALAGRLWCGYACPQTVWTESFLWIERKIEGTRQQQMKLDRAPMSLRKFRLKATKHAIWIAFSLFTGFMFVSYFTPARELAVRLAGFALGPWETFWLFFYGFATYGNAGFMREQVCKYMCPYARFQSAMFDNDTLVISYDTKRGDPRGSRRSNVDPKQQGLGDCINCTMCVQVCPTGIDIRDGLQYDCIGCAACIDVCDDVMDKMNYPRGLIRYTTQHELEGGKTQVFRPRILVYGAILIALCGLFAWRLSQRVAVGLDVLHDRNQLYREAAGKIENVYLLKVINKDDATHRYTLAVGGIDGIALAEPNPVIEAASGAVVSVPIAVRAAESALPSSSTPVQFSITAEDDPTLTVSTEAKFLGPAK